MLFSIHIFRYYGAVQCLERNKDPCQIYSNTCVLKFVSEPSALCLEDWRSEIRCKKYINEALLPSVGQTGGVWGNNPYESDLYAKGQKDTIEAWLRLDLTLKGDGTRREAIKILIVQ